MRVAIFSDTYPPEINGVATSVRNLYRTLKEHGHEVLVVTTNFYGNELFEDGDILRMPGMPLKLYGYDYRLASFYSKGGEAVIKAFRPDVIHVQHDGGIGQFGFIMAKKLNLHSLFLWLSLRRLRLVDEFRYYDVLRFDVQMRFPSDGLWVDTFARRSRRIRTLLLGHVLGFLYREPSGDQRWLGDN